MLLSIGMIVKNEEKYLRDCLEAISPILQKLDSELIIVDTGSTDSTVEIAKKFTDKVFHFEWCDDFAAARNAAMKRAKGRWYMSVDADEILEDAQGIIDFFETGDYKKYNSASYIVKSSNDANLIKATDFNALRLIKVKNDSFYINAIHEQFEKIYPPVKFLPTVANHYGYVTESNTDYIEHKMKRNLGIMLKELEKDPSNSLMYFNISNSYKLLNDKEKALEYYIKGLELAKEKNDITKYIFYTNIIAIYRDMGEYLKAIELTEEYFDSKVDELGTDLAVYFLRADSYYQLGKDKEAINAYKCYLKFYAEFKQGLHNTLDTLQHPVDYSYELAYRTGILRLAKLLYKSNDYSEAKKYLRSVPISEFLADKENIPFWLELEISILIKLEDYPEIVGLYNHLDEDAKKTMQIENEKRIQNSEHRDRIISEFASVNPDIDRYFELMRLRKSYYEGELTVEAVRRFVDDLEDIPSCYADIVYLYLYKKIPINSLKIDAYRIREYFFGNAFFHFSDLVMLIYDIYISGDEELSTHSKIWVSSLFYYELISGRLQEDRVENIFTAYGEISFLAISAIFKEDIMQEAHIQLMPIMYRVGYYSYCAIASYSNGDDVKYIRYLRKALKEDERLKDVIEFLLHKIESKVKEKQNILSEFEAYAMQAKEAILRLIDIGQYKEVSQFIQTYERMCPNDPEMQEIKSKIPLNNAT